MNAFPVAFEGELVPHFPPTVAVKLRDTDRRMGTTDIQFGQKQATVDNQKPLDVGEKRHHELLSAIKGISVDQKADQTAAISTALQQNRDWRI